MKEKEKEKREKRKRGRGKKDSHLVFYLPTLD